MMLLVMSWALLPARTQAGSVKVAFLILIYRAPRRQSYCAIC
jgi:hypothetical protein